MNKARLEAFSDGVFGFAITLLVLGVQVPSLRTVSDPELRVALIQALSQLVPYLTSFATIGIIWLNHHAMFAPVERVEDRTLMLNLLLLLVVTFIPYPTAVLSRYGALPSSAFLYGCTLTALSLTYSVLWGHIARKGLSSVRRNPKQARTRFRRNLASRGSGLSAGHGHSPPVPASQRHDLLYSGSLLLDPCWRRDRNRVKV
jgi:uncharacterized membrane protein